MQAVDILIKNGWVLPVDDERRLIEHGAVAIQGDKIVAVGSTTDLERAYQAPKVIDASDKLVMPGLINTHTHLVSGLHRGMLDDVESVEWLRRLFSGYYGVLDEEEAYHSAMLVCLDFIKSGTTTLVDCGTLPGLEEPNVQAVKDSGIRAVLGRMTWDLFDDRAAIPGVHPRLRMTAEQGLIAGEDFIRKHDGAANGRIQAWIDLHQVPNVSDELGRGTAALVSKYNSGVLTHAGVSQAMIEITRRAFGLAEIDRFDRLGLVGPKFIGAHMGWLNGKEMLIMRERGGSVAHTPSSMHGAYGALAYGNIPEMRQMGVNIALGTDGANSSNTLDMVRMLFLVAEVHKEVRLDPMLISGHEAIEMGTRCGARAVGLPDQLGAVEPGRKADLILFDLMRPEWVPFSRVNLVANLVYSASGDSVDTTIVNGRILMEGRKVLTMDESAVLRRCQQLFQRLAKKAEAVGVV